MTATVLRFTGRQPASNSLFKPIDTTSLEIGLVVTNAWYGGLWTICDSNASGYVIINETGETHHGQQLACLGPRTKITPVEPTEIKTPEEVTTLLAIAEQRKQEAITAEQQRREEHKRDTQHLINQLRQQYPWAKPAGKMSEQARAAANLRRELQETFPGIKFSVRSSSASMTCSVDIEWTLGPTIKEVEAISDKYAYNKYNVEEDYHGHDNSPNAEAVSVVLGQARFVGHRRNHGGIFEQICRDIAALFNQEFHSINDGRKSDPKCHIRLSEYAHNALERCSFPPGAIYKGVISTFDLIEGQGEAKVKTCNAHEIVTIVYEIPTATAPTLAQNDQAPAQSSDEIVLDETGITRNGITVRTNDEKQGFEILAPGINLSDEIRAALWKNGFRWSKAGKWGPGRYWAKQTLARRTFALSLLNINQETA